MFMDMFEKFEGFRSFADITQNPELVADEPGGYAISLPRGFEVVFQEKGTGAWHKGKNPNVRLARLRDEWVPGANILYFGETGSGTSSRRLRTRAQLLLKFGRSEPCGH